MDRDIEREDAGVLSRRELLKRGVVVGAVIAVPAFGTAHVGGAYGSTAVAGRLRSPSSRMRHSVVGFSEQPPLWSAC